MPRTIDYYFSLSSPWAYIGHRLFMTIAERQRVAVNYKPVFLGRVFAQTGGLPLPQRHPVRQRYRLVDLQRWRERRGVALNLQPKFSPFDVNLADRFVVAIVAANKDPDPFMRRAMAGVWEEERNLGDPLVIAELAEAAGLDFDLAPGGGARHADRGGLRAQPRERGRGRRLRLAGLCARRRGVLGPGPARAPRRRADERAGAVPADAVTMREVDRQWSVVSEASNE